MNGVLVIDKPCGPTSHDVVSAVRKVLREKKVGHTGTLDPTATGVLPLVLGEATKVARYLSGGDKTYRATLHLGVSTDTLDGAGQVISEREVKVSEDEVRAVATSFLGEAMQTPPMFSAKKVDGKRLYELARQGIEVEREAKRVHIYEIEVLEVSLPNVVMDVKCSAGTYVRVLARDIGEKLGTGAYLQQLRRLGAGPFTLTDAIVLQEIIDDPKVVAGRLIPVTRALAELPSIELPRGLGRMIRDGYQLTVADLRALDVPALEAEAVVALKYNSGELVAVARAMVAASELDALRRDQQALKTERVFGRE